MPFRQFVRMVLDNWKYRFRHWLFSWRQDGEGDLVFVVANRLAFTKYKEHTLVTWNGDKLEPAGKWQGNECVAVERQPLSFF